MISGETIERVLRAIKTPVNQDYFFSKLSSPDWIEPLRKAGFFAGPGAPTRRGEEEYHWRWAPSEYLARMASLEPEVVTQAFENMEIGDNPFVRRDIVKAAMSMPAANAARLARIEADWLERRDQISALHAIDHAKLAVKVAAAGEADSASRLIRAVFYVRSREAGALREPTKTNYRVERREYQLVLEQILPKAGEAIPDLLLTLLCDLLDDSIKSEEFGGTPSAPRDYSELWRPAVEDHEQNRPSSPCDALTSAIRDLATRAAGASSSEQERIVELLEQRQWHVFHRIAMHVICEGGSAAIYLAKRKLLDRANFDALWYRHEYARLLRTFFASLDVAEQATILGWIQEGPQDLAEWIAWREAQSGTRPIDAVCQARSDCWRYERTHPIYDLLPPAWKERYAGWRSQFDEPKLAEFAAVCEYRWGESAPKSAEELGQMECSELVNYLKTWKPHDEWHGPSLRGLAQALRAAVTAKPSWFAANATAFAELAPGYVSTILEGLSTAMTSGQTLPWTTVLELCTRVAGNRQIAPERGDQEDADDALADWKWTRGAAADLIEQALKKDDILPFELREKVWPVLALLSEDPHPSTEDEADWGAAFDPFTASLNSTRGRAFHAVMRYVVWVARHLPRPNTEELRLERGLSEVAEALAVLDRHLDVTADPSPAVRSVYGCNFPLLAATDAGWASDARSRVFPTAPGEEGRWAAAWNAYIRFNGPYTAVCRILMPEYSRAIERCGEYPDENHALAEAKRCLAEHLMILLGRGVIDSQPGSLVRRFFEATPAALRTHAISFVGRSLRNEASPPEAAIERFLILWAWLAEQGEKSAKGSPERLQLAGFGSWFVSRRFDTNWCFTEIIRALRLAGRVELAHSVIEVLTALAPDCPDQSLDCLREIIKSDKEGWEISAAEVQVRRILHAALSQPSKNIQTTAEDVVHGLGARGFFSYRDLLQRAPAE